MQYVTTVSRLAAAQTRIFDTGLFEQLVAEAEIIYKAQLKTIWPAIGFIVT
jgi:hypothetical protein